MKLVKPLFQWDVNQKLLGCQGEYVDFIINDKVYRVEIDNNQCAIPDEFLQSANNKVLYECMSDGTLKQHDILIHSRPKPPEYIYTPTEVKTFQILVDDVNRSIETLNTEVQTIKNLRDSGAFDGKDGYTPIKGVDYFDGEPGMPGEPGQPGYTPIKGVDYFDGAPGAPGKDGEDGNDGYTPVKGVDYFDGNDGYTPIKGVDYFDGKDGSDYVITEADYEAIAQLTKDLVPPYNDTEIKGEITRVNESITELERILNVDVNANPRLIPNTYVNATNNQLAESSSFSLTEPIHITKGQRITLRATGYRNVVGMICICNEDNTSRDTVVASISDNEEVYTFVATDDCYVCCSFKSNVAWNLDITLDYYNDCYSNISDYTNIFDVVFSGEREISVIVAESGKYVASDGSIGASSNFSISETIRLLKGQKIVVNARGYSNGVSMIAKYNPDSNTYNSLVNSRGDTVMLYEYTATDNIDVRLSYNKNSTINASIITDKTESVRLNRIEDNINYLYANSEYPKVPYEWLFTKAICIGDSLTRGYNGSSNLEKCYPYYFNKFTKIETVNYGLSGRTAKGLWDEFVSTWASIPNYDLVIIYLGTNGGLTDSIDTDCNLSDYTKNADTNTGCYGKILGRIKAENPNCKIFVVAGPNEYVRRTSMNSVVRNLAKAYNVGLIDLENSMLTDDGNPQSISRQTYRPIDGIHYNELGFLTLASLIYDEMKKYLQANPSYLITQ